MSVQSLIFMAPVPCMKTFQAEMQAGILSRLGADHQLVLSRH